MNKLVTILMVMLSSVAHAGLNQTPATFLDTLLSPAQGRDNIYEVKYAGVSSSGEPCTVMIQRNQRSGYIGYIVSINDFGTAGHCGSVANQDGDLTRNYADRTEWKSTDTRPRFLASDFERIKVYAVHGGFEVQCHQQKRAKSYDSYAFDKRADCKVQ